MDQERIGRRMASMQRGMEAFGRGDVDVIKATMSPDIVWHLPGNSPLAGDYRGPEEVVQMLVDLQRRTGGNVEPVDLLAGDEFIMSFTRFRGDGGFEVEFADAFRFDDDDLITEYWSLASDQDAYDALLS